MKDHNYYLKEAVKVSEESLAKGNHPFGAILVSPEGEIILRQGNVEVTKKSSIGHAETKLMEKAGELFDKEYLWNCTMYTTCEPCVMCCGAVYWTNVGTIVYGVSEKKLLEITGSDDRNPTFDLPSREVFSRGQKNIKVIGPIEEMTEEILRPHLNYWNNK
ncbi:MAG: nucleoside deaminase [Miniphocaeibacter sp.]|uniref:nucleoside deaminase n=1 Tax=Miniphocaeibacter sp. TaxID=3100973 RepID=UPI001852A1AC|nr:nucleoside deaminase [Gallicola sp.]